MIIQKRLRGVRKVRFHLIVKAKSISRLKVSYKGQYAKSIYYRQLLEYKKEKLFIFGSRIFMYLIVGVLLAFLCDKRMPVSVKCFLGVFVASYISFALCGVSKKWATELSLPYTFLIPDTNFNKLWYSTKLEHIRSVVYGSIVIVPVGIVLQLPIYTIFLQVIVYVAIQALNVYMEISVESFLGNVMITTFRQFIKMGFFMALVMIGVVFAAIGYMLANINVAFIVFAFYTFAMAFLFAYIASRRFNKMEQIE